MANRFYSVVLGEHLPVQVTEGASTSSEVIELRIADTAYSYGKAQIDHAINALRMYLLTKETNPAA
jgi:hypothetical protein